MTLESVSKKTNTLAIVGFILSLTGYLGIVGAILAIISLNQISKNGEKGRGLAIATIIIACIPIVVIAVLMLLGPMIQGSFADINSALGQ